MRHARWRCALAGVALLGAVPLAAQDSQFSLRAPGTPGRAESARSRATGGAFAPFDGTSSLTDAALADLLRITAAAQVLGSYRHVTVGSTEGNTRATRFPSLLLSSPPLGARLTLATGFSTYLDRTFRVSLRDSAIVRGQLERFNDVLSSDGAVADVRFAAAIRASRRLAFGASLHLLSGAARATAARQFDDSTTYLPTLEIADIQHTGIGFGASGLFDITSSLRLSLWYRSDSRLTVAVNDQEAARYDLPTGVGGGLRWAPSAELRFAGAVAWRSWQDAGGRNTLDWAVGAEGGNPRLPARLGVRGAQLPFGPPGVTPREWAIAGGLGRVFSEGRARIDFTVERLSRTGGDVTEGVWSLLVGLTVQP
jgi:hypothetical protein